MNAASRLVRVLVLAAAGLTLASRPATAADDETPLAERYLVEGKLADGEKVLAAELEKDPKDAQARFGLGVTQFLRGVERMAQAFHRFGLKDDSFSGIPFLRLTVPRNAAPEPIRYEDLRAVFRDFVADTARAEATLAKFDDDGVKLPIHFGRVRLDLDGDGRATDEEALWRIYDRLVNRGGGPGRIDPDAARAFLIAFDRGDVAWLRGYCHLLMALAEVYLAHDARALFDHSAHLVFSRPETPFPFLKGRKADEAGFSFELVVDWIAAIHMIRLPVEDPKRMASALAHLEAMVRLSRESWSHYLKETDDDHEWIPNPKQHTVMPNGEMTDAMVKDWLAVLDEVEAILAGKRLIPFWRDAGDGRGVNLRRAFTEPRGFDLVLWAQGTAAAPYLEQGPLTDPALWRRINQSYRGQLLGFAAWFN
jgi:hypothetical protein